MTLLSNTYRDGAPILPITGAVKVYAENIDISNEAGWTQVESPEVAGIAILHIAAPFEPRGPGFELFFHAGSLEFTPEESRHGCGQCARRFRP